MRTPYNYIKSWTCLLAGLILIVASCKRTDFPVDKGAVPGAAKFSASPKASNANIVDFKNESGGFKALWDLGNGTSGEGNTISGSYPEAGTYTVKLTVFTKEGFASVTKQVVIAQTNTDMLRGPEYDALTGTATNVNGKTWVIEKGTVGHLGLGPITGTTDEWFKAGPEEKKAFGIYDDEMTFNLNGWKYSYANNGTTYANKDNAKDLGVTGATEDVMVNYTPPGNMTWKLVFSGGKKFINISDNGFIAYYTGASQYEILSITADQMYLRTTSKAVADQAWYLRLSRKGFTPTPPVVVEKPLKAANLSDDFDAAGNITWLAENITYKKAYDNPAPLPVNTSAKVGFYAKKDGVDAQYGNLQATLPYRLDLSTKNKVKMKVFLPSYNDFSKVNPKVVVKLQNSLLGGNAWTTQREVAKVLNVFNSWGELEFDFAAFSADTVYDRIVVQLGGEGHPNPGIFYIDDFEFK